MFENLKITAEMQSVVCFNDFLKLDCILSAAKAKDILQGDYYTDAKQAGEIQLVIDTLSEFLKFNRELGVFHASCAVTEDKEFVTAYSKRWNSGKDECVKFVGKGKQEIDTARGFFKSYRNPLIYKPIPQVVFYACGDKQEISRLLENISFLGKKSSQGYGKIKKWTVESIDEDRSIFYGDKLMRFVPADKIKGDYDMREAAVIPPTYRDERTMCYVPINS